MKKIQFDKTVIYKGNTTRSRILLVHGKNYFGEPISPLVIQKFANETVINELTKLEEKKADVDAIVNFLLEEGYAKNSNC